MGRASRGKRRPRNHQGALYSRLANESIVKKLRKLPADALNEVLQQSFYTSLQQQDIDLAIAESAILRERIDRNYAHVFVDSRNVIDFVDSNKIYEKDFPAVIQLIRAKGSSATAFHFIGEKYSTFCLIEPETYIVKGSKKLPSMAIDTGDGYESMGVERTDIGTLPFTQHAYKKFNEWSGVPKRNWVRILNLFLYMDAFPDSVKTGPPDIFIDSSYSKKHIKTITESDALKEVYSRGPVTPHMRRGHFRLLTSEVYTKKRWQAVYVKPTMVKGKAETIVDTEAV